MKRLRVLVLLHEHLMPPADALAVPDDHNVPWKTEFDVLTGIEKLGHQVRSLGAGDDLMTIRAAIEDFDPHVVFNMLEGFHDIPAYDYYVTSYLELLKRSYTGCNPRGLMLARDKALSKKILSYHRIRVPAFQVFPRGKAGRRPARLRFPLFAKSLNDDGSLGLAQASIVYNDQKLADRVRYLHETFNSDVIAEEYIAGREIYVPILGNRRVQVLPPIELQFKNLAEGAEPIATSKVKWDWEYQRERGIELGFPEDLPEPVRNRIIRTGKRVYKALNMSGYGRIDLRVTPEGEVFVIEANPNPDISYGCELPESGERAGIAYGALLQRILSLGIAYQAEWRAAGV